jgi:hypothetical protein
VIELLFVLFLGHCVADYALQSQEMGRGKNRNRQDHSNIPPGQKPAVVWPMWLTAHAGTHALAVYLITGLWIVAVLELIAHWVIDFLKCDNKLNVYQDQALHLACKALWVFLIYLAS